MRLRYTTGGGGALLARRPKKTVILKSIWVTPAARGRGVGTRILEEVCEALDYYGLRCRLRVVPTGQMDAEALRHWYESFGFKRVGTKNKMVRRPH